MHESTDQQVFDIQAWYDQNAERYQNQFEITQLVYYLRH